MLSEEMTGRLVNEIRRFLIADAATLSKANDEQLRRRIADIVDHKLVNYRISPQERSRIVRLVFSSIRGMGILDEILADDSITEITCHAKGAHYLNPNVRTVIDIGGGYQGNQH